MNITKNKFTISIIIAILAGVAFGYYLAGVYNPKSTVTPTDISASGTDNNIKDAGDVLKKLDELAE